MGNNANSLIKSNHNIKNLAKLKEYILSVLKLKGRYHFISYY